jgi:hypothetical protein
MSDLPVRLLPGAIEPFAFICSHSVEEVRMCFLSRGLSFICAAVLISGVARADIAYFEKEDIWYVVVTEELDFADYQQLAAFSLSIDPNMDTIIAVMASPGGTRLRAC